MSALLLGSISTIADTSEVQREAFNAAFAEHGLDWNWSREDYVAKLDTAGGRQRIADFAASQGEQVDADAVHGTKSRIFQERCAAGLSARPGVVETIREAKSAGVKLALVTTTSPENVTAVLQGLGDQLSADDFDVVLSSAQVQAAKPDAAAYQQAVSELRVSPQDCVAVEDNVDGAKSAAAAGVTVIAFPNANTTSHDFAAASRRVDRLELADLQGELGSSAS